MGVEPFLVLYTERKAVKEAYLTERKTSMPPPPPIIWELQNGQTFVQSAEGAFGIKYLSIVQKDMGIFYALKAERSGEPDVKATSVLLGNAGTGEVVHVGLGTRVESLGYVGEWNVGIVHIDWMDRPDQIITLAISPAGSSTPVWRLEPVLQLYIPGEARGLYASMMPDTHELAEVEFYGPFKKQQLAFFRLRDPETGNPRLDVAPLFMRIPRGHDAVTAVLLTEAEYLALAGSTVNPTTYLSEMRFSLEDAQPTSIRNTRFMEIATRASRRLPAPDFERKGVEWPFGRSGGGGGADMWYWSGVLQADVGLSTLVVSYAAQLEKMGWQRVEEHQDEVFAWQAWVLLDEEEEQWKGLVLLLKNPGVTGQYIFYSRADKMKDEL